MFGQWHLITPCDNMTRDSKGWCHVGQCSHVKQWHLIVKDWYHVGQPKTMTLVIYIVGHPHEEQFNIINYMALFNKHRYYTE